MKLCYGRVLLRNVIEKRGSKVWEEVCIYGGSQEKQCYQFNPSILHKQHNVHFLKGFIFYLIFFFSFQLFFFQKDRKREGVRYEEENVDTVSVSPIKNKIKLPPWLGSSL